MFTDRSGELPGEPMHAYGVAVAEVDGSLAAFVAGYGEANRLLGWRDDRGAFVDRVVEARGRAAGTNEYGEAAPLADDGAHTLGVAAGDTDGDGDEELYAHNTGAFAGRSPEPDRLLDPSDRGWGDLLDDGRNRRARNGAAGRAVAVIDRDGDGTYGVAVSGYAAPLRLYEGGHGDLADVAPEVGVDFLAGGRTLLAAPLLGDRTDLFYGVERGPNLLLRNDAGGFTDFAPERGLSDTHGDARGAALVDVGGRLAVACGNWEGHGRLWVPAGDGSERGRDGDTGGGSGVDAAGAPGRYRDAAPPALREPGRVRNVVAADLDNDGRQELFCNHFGEANRLFRRREPGEGEAETGAVADGGDAVGGDAADGDGVDGGATTSSGDATGWERVDAGPAAEPEGHGTGAAVGDLDGDGTLELLVAHGEEGAERLTCYAVANDGDWVRVLPRTRHGAPARGARVRLATDAGSQVRVIDGGSGYLCQMEPVAHFGLGDAEPVEAAVTWPDGTSRTVDVAARETVEVPYDPS